MVESVDPCGIPCVMGLKVDLARVVWVDWMRLVKNDLKMERAFDVKLNWCSSLWRSFE